ncbi:MAG: hypothetical protein A4E55_02382 [Pelotomaculum sp. PtaU1.Bin035]|nr:MAG: hypothetical protein A4E55_02382 [Pelotomaculum sp. PtaU1.Bin035]
MKKKGTGRLQIRKGSYPKDGRVITPPPDDAARMEQQVKAYREKRRQEAVPQPLKRKPKFGDSHTRVTTYLRSDLLSKVRELKKENLINSITNLLDEAVGYYLSKHFDFPYRP